jgi:mannan endo-1,4-beta-mannosidase
MDYIHLGASPANWIDYSKIDFIKDWWNNKGIVSASWHWLVPPTELETDPLKFTYTLSTSFKASNIPLDGTWENKVAKADLAKLVGYLKLLQDNNIPVIWRPLHEAAGNIYVYNNGTAWFWWGASGADAYKAVWQFVFNYFKDQGVHNLIWVWTTQTGDEAFYPGDAYVDIIGRDIYNNLDASKIAEEFKSIQKKHPTKLVTLSECGSVEKISTQWTSGAAWSYFMPWYDYDRTKDVNAAAFTLTTHQHADAAWWKDAMTKDYVISREQMPSLKGSK